MMRVGCGLQDGGRMVVGCGLQGGRMEAAGWKMRTSRPT